MPQLQPMPLFLNEPAGADRGLICGYQLQARGSARARRWLLDAAFLPASLRDVLQEHDDDRRVECTDGGLITARRAAADDTRDRRVRHERCPSARRELFLARHVADPGERRRHARRAVLAAPALNGYPRTDDL